MDMELKNSFLSLWPKYFKNAQLPICLFYSDDETYDQLLRPLKNRMCLIGQLANVFRGDDLAFANETVGCPGGRRYLVSIRKLQHLDIFIKNPSSVRLRTCM